MKVSIILAAGEGTRMKSNRPKVMHEILGRPMLYYVLDACKKSNIEKNIVVVGHHKEEIIEAFKGNDTCFKTQPIGDEHPYGTGFAVSIALDEVDDSDTCIVLNGDSPLIGSETLNGFINYHENKCSDMTILTAELKNPTNYGRILRDKDANVVGIREEKDASEKEKLIREINSGIFAFKAEVLKDAIKKINTDNAQNELYLTDVVKILVENERKVNSYKLKDNNEILGVNSRYELSISSDILMEKINKSYMVSGVTLIDPRNIYIEPGAKISENVTIYPNSYIDKDSEILEGATIISSRIINSKIGRAVRIESSTIESSTVGDNTTVGPYAHLRPNSILGKNCKVGNFVELKNSNVGDGSKMTHLAYIGDADVGSGVNIGCGVVFVNYNGKEKFRTKVGDNAFIGSNANLVAPVEVEDGGYVAAGSTITKKVLKGQLSVERAPQRNIDGWVAKKGLDK